MSDDPPPRIDADASDGGADAAGEAATTVKVEPSKEGQQGRHPVLVILGVTAAGKTKLAVDLAQALREGWGKACEIVNADVLQCYRGSPIVTNKATLDEQGGIPHHLIGFADPGEDMSINDFRARAAAAIADMRSRGVLPIVVGGSDYYVKALVSRQFDLAQVADVKPEDPAREEEVEACAMDDAAKEALHRKLAAADPASAAKLHRNDVRRVRRYLEIYEETGEAASVLFKKQRTAAQRYGAFVYDPCRFLFLDCDDGTLVPRIHSRLRAMRDRGLIDEINGEWTPATS